MRTSASTRLAAGARPDPLAESIRRAESHQVRVSLRLGAPDDSTHWVNCAELLSEAGGFDRWRKELAGWLIDRYGLRWQIVPAVFMDIMQGKDRARSKRVTDAMMTMVKFDIAAIEKAARSDR